jgi:hypothetical protein
MTINQLQHIERSLIWTSASLRALIVLFALRRPALLMQCWTFALFCAVTAIWLPFWNPFDVQRLAMADCVLIPLKIAVAAELFYRAMEFVPMIERRAFFALLVAFTIPALVVMLGYYDSAYRTADEVARLALALACFAGTWLMCTEPPEVTPFLAWHAVLVTTYFAIYAIAGLFVLPHYRAFLTVNNWELVAEIVCLCGWLLLLRPRKINHPVTEPPHFIGELPRVA